MNQTQARSNGETATIVRAAQGIADGLWEWDVDADQVWCCKTFLASVQPDGDAGLEGWLKCVHENDRALFERNFQLCADLGDALDFQCRLHATDGSMRWFRIRGVATNLADGRQLLSGGIQDIHNHHQAAESVREQQRRQMQSQRMEAIDCLAGGIAHEFNNVLQAVTGYVAFARDELTPGTTSHEDLGQALTAADRATQLTRSLLSFARADEVCEDRVDLREIVAGLVELLRPILGENIDLRLHADERPLITQVNVLELRQSLLNFCINARDAMPDGGSLAVSATPFRVDEGFADDFTPLMPGAYCRLTVTDTGCGISQLEQRRIFDPFFTTKPAGQGTGLGLAAVYGFAQRSSGRVEVYSAGENRGSTFTLYLPVQEWESMEEATTPDAAFEGQSPLVLLIEDDDAVRDVGRRMLEGAGCRVLCEANGEAGLESYIHSVGEVDLVLLDIVLPTLSGRRVSEEIRRLQSTVPIVFCTGYDPASVHGDPLNRLGNAVIAKPFHKSELIEVVFGLIANRPVANAVSD